MSEDFDAIDFREWYEKGIASGYIAEPVCYFHDALPMTSDEEAEVDAGGDPCMNVIRIWNV